MTSATKAFLYTTAIVITFFLFIALVIFNPGIFIGLMAMAVVIILVGSIGAAIFSIYDIIKFKIEMKEREKILTKVRKNEY